MFQAIEIVGMKIFIPQKGLNKTVEKLHSLSTDIIDFPL